MVLIRFAKCDPRHKRSIKRIVPLSRDQDVIKMITPGGIAAAAFETSRGMPPEIFTGTVDFGIIGSQQIVAESADKGR